MIFMCVGENHSKMILPITHVVQKILTQIFRGVLYSFVYLILLKTKNVIFEYFFKKC